MAWPERSILSREQRDGEGKRDGAGSEVAIEAKEITREERKVYRSATSEERRKKSLFSTNRTVKAIMWSEK
jgi:hypothetical protein